MTLAVLLASALLAGCTANAGGIRLEGTPTASAGPRTDRSVVSGAPSEKAPRPPAASLPLESSPPPTGPSPSGKLTQDGTTDVISLLKHDPKVSRNVKDDLRQCHGDLWPVSVAYGRATGGAGTDLVINVSSCADKVGVGSYVYRRSSSGTLVNVFAAERPPVRSAIEDGHLVVTRDVFIGSEPTCCPSGRVIITYVWQKGLFKEAGRKRTDTAGESPAPEETRKD